MISNQLTHPPLYHSYTNSQRGQASYHGYLDEIETNIVPKNQIKLGRDQPIIGTFRIGRSNFQKKDRYDKGINNNAYYMSIAMDRNVSQMGLAQIRVEDYYLLRNSKADSEMYRVVMNKSTNKIYFNSKLMKQGLAIPQIYIPPRVPQGVNRIVPNQTPIVHGPYDRLMGLKSNLNTRHMVDSIQNLQSNSFNQMGRTNIMPQNEQVGVNALPQTTMVEQNQNYSKEVMQMVVEQMSINEMFLKFVHQQLYQTYNKKENINHKLDNFIFSAFMKLENHEEKRLVFAHQLKLKSQTPMNEIIEICKKYGQCLFIKRILDGYQKDIQIKIQKTKPNPEQLQYFMTIWRMLQSTYTLHIKQLYRYTHNQITEEGFKTLLTTLEQRQSTLLFQHQRYQPFKQPQANHKDTAMQTLNHMLLYQDKINRPSGNHKYFSNSTESEQFQNQIFLLSSLKYQLNQLYEQQKLQRQQHLYDMINQNMSDYHYDEYAIRNRNNKKKEEISIMIYREPNSDRKQKKEEDRVRRNPQSSGKKSVSAKSQLKLKSFLLESNTSLNVQDFMVEFVVSIFWETKGKEKAKYRTVQGVFRISQIGQEKLEEIITEVSKSFLDQYIRHNAKFSFGQLIKTKHKRFHYSINCQILQEKLNIPPPYIYIVKYKSQNRLQCQVEKLQIKNHFGEVRWKNINIETFDFKEQSFNIGDNAIECTIKCLNQPCEITFYNFPSYVLKLEENYYPTAIQYKMKQKIQKNFNNDLISINWKDRRYTVSSNFFYEQTQEQRRQLSKSKKQNKKSLLSKYELIDFTIQEAEQ